MHVARKFPGLMASSICCLAVQAVAVEPSQVDPARVHRLVADAAIAILPEPIVELFRDNRADFARYAAAPAVDWPTDPKRRRLFRWHRVECDVAAQGPSASQRREALESFPRDRSSAVKFYREHGVRSGGLLPFAIQECYDELIEALRSGDAAAVLERAGYLTHFAADAAEPFRCTVNNDGTLTGNARFSSPRGDHPNSPDATIRERFGVGLIDRHQGDYRSALNTMTGSIAPIDTPIDAAFAVIGDSLAVVDEIAEADRLILEQLHVTDRRDFDTRRDDYYSAMNSRCGGIRVERLAAAAVLAGNMISGAWRAAGSPTTAAIRARPRIAGGSDAPTRRKNAFLGSKRSDVYHLPSCRFAAKIHRKNRVRFESSQQARTRGRRPCKVCKPK